MGYIQYSIIIWSYLKLTAYDFIIGRLQKMIQFKHAHCAYVRSSGAVYAIYLCVVVTQRQTLSGPSVVPLHLNCILISYMTIQCVCIECASLSCHFCFFVFFHSLVCMWFCLFSFLFFFFLFWMTKERNRLDHWSYGVGVWRGKKNDTQREHWRSSF